MYFIQRLHHHVCLREYPLIYYMYNIIHSSLRASYLNLKPNYINIYISKKLIIKPLKHLH